MLFLFSACMMFDLAGDSVYQGQPSSDPVIDVGGTEPEELAAPGRGPGGVE